MMDETLQLFMRLQAFLDSNDLTDTEVSRALYQEYLAFCRDVNQRVQSIYVLLQKKRLAEAAAAMAKGGDLLEAVRQMSFQGREVLLDLADMYGWEKPSSLPLEKLQALEKASGEMTSLQPLLSEYRRIARSDDYVCKLMLLRKITRMDTKNPEWMPFLREAETRYLGKLIEDAKQAILGGEDMKLVEIQRQLDTEEWHVAIPAMVRKKIDGHVQAYRRRCNQEKRQKILQEINDAYAAFQTQALADAILRWKQTCSMTGHTPTHEETTQVEEAEQFLKQRQADEAKQTNFQNTITRILALIREHADGEEVDSLYADAQAFEMELPEYLEQRVELYHDTLERERRSQLFSRVCRILGISVVALGAVVLMAVFGVEELETRRIVSELRSAIQAKNVVGAHEILEKMKKQHSPRVARRAAVMHQQAKLKELEQKLADARRTFAEKQGKLLELLKENYAEKREMERLLAQCRDAVDSLDISHEEIPEKKSLARLKKDVSEKLDQQQQVAEEKYRKAAQEAVELAEKMAKLLEENRLEEARKTLSSYEELVGKADELKERGVTEETQQECRENLEKGGLLREKLIATEVKNREFDEVKRRLEECRTLDTRLEVILQRMREVIADRKSWEEWGRFCDNLKADMECLQPVMAYQGKETVPSVEKEHPYFQDILPFLQMKKQWLENRERLYRTQEKQNTEAQRFPMYWLHYQIVGEGENVGKEDCVYYTRNPERRSPGGGVSNVPSFSFYDVMGDMCTLFWERPLGELEEEKYKGQFSLKRSVRYNSAQGSLAEIRLIPPDLNNLDEVKRSWKTGRNRAVHQLLAIQMYEETLTRRQKSEADSGGGDVPMAVANCLAKLATDPNCSGYWMVKFGTELLDALHNSREPELAPFIALEGKWLRALEGKRDFVSYLKDVTRSTWDMVARGEYNGKELEEAARAFQMKFRLLEFLQTAGFQYLGFYTPEGQFVPLAGNTHIGGDIWCRNADGTGCQIVGVVEENGPKLLVPEAALAGRILFSVSEEKSRQLQQYRDDPVMGRVKPPKFWPASLK